MKYDLDIGKWERGKVVTVEAGSPQEAVRLGWEEIEEGEYVVQARETESRRLVYDFVQGFVDNLNP